MKYILILFLTLIFNHKSLHANEYDDKYELERKANIEKAEKANYGMPDTDLLRFIKDMFKYMPEEYDEILNKDKLEKEKILNNFRDYYIQVGISIPEIIKLYDESPGLKDFYAQMWFDDTIGVEYAEKAILNLSNEEYKMIVEVAQDIIANNEKPKHKRLKGSTLTKSFPKQLDFIKIKSISIHDEYCEIYLYRGVGSIKRIGFRVKKETNGNWNLYSFNYLKSWNNNIIKIK